MLKRERAFTCPGCGQDFYAASFLDAERQHDFIWCVWGCGQKKQDELRELIEKRRRRGDDEKRPTQG